MDLIEHNKNGWMVDVEDVEGLAHWTKYAIENSNSLDDILFIDTANIAYFSKTEKPKQYSLRNYMSLNNFREKDEPNLQTFLPALIQLD